MIVNFVLSFLVYFPLLHVTSTVYNVRRIVPFFLALTLLTCHRPLIYFYLYILKQVTTFWYFFSRRYVLRSQPRFLELPSHGSHIHRLSDRTAEVGTSARFCTGEATQCQVSAVRQLKTWKQVRYK